MQSKQRDRFVRHQLGHSFRCDCQQLRPHVAGRLAGANGQVLKAGFHRLAVAVALVFGGAQEGVGPESFGRTIKIAVERQCLGKHLRRFAQASPIRIVDFDPSFQFLEFGIPAVIVTAQTRKIPAVRFVDVFPGGQNGGTHISKQAFGNAKWSKTETSGWAL